MALVFTLTAAQVVSIHPLIMPHAHTAFDGCVCVWGGGARREKGRSDRRSRTGGMAGLAVPYIVGPAYSEVP